MQKFLLLLIKSTKFDSEETIFWATFLLKRVHFIIFIFLVYFAVIIYTFICFVCLFLSTTKKVGSYKWLLTFTGALLNVYSMSLLLKYQYFLKHVYRHTQNITFPPRLALGGFPALTTLVGPVDSVETHRDGRRYNRLHTWTQIVLKWTTKNGEGSGKKTDSHLISWNCVQ